MPGTYVQDATELTNLADPAGTPGTAGVTIAANTNGTGFEVDRPRLVRFKLSLGAITGTTPTADIELQGSDVSNFASGVVSYGRFKQRVTADAQGTFYLTAYCQKAYVRAVTTVGGTTPSFAAVLVQIVEPNYERTTTDSA